jgi:hypothetical protein
VKHGGRSPDRDGAPYHLPVPLAEVDRGRTRPALAPHIAGAHYTLALPIVFLDANAAERYLTIASRRFPAPGSPLGDDLPSLLAVIDMHRGNAAAGLTRMRALEPSHPETHR